MTQQHTPGPWVVDDHPQGYEDLIESEVGFTVGQVHWHGERPTAEDLANARFIAAAPDLLAALEELYHCLNAITRPGEYVDELAQARAAITKARPQGRGRGGKA